MICLSHHLSGSSSKQYSEMNSNIPSMEQQRNGDKQNWLREVRSCWSWQLCKRVPAVSWKKDWVYFYEFSWSWDMKRKERRPIEPSLRTPSLINWLLRFHLCQCHWIPNWACFNYIIILFFRSSREESFGTHITLRQVRSSFHFYSVPFTLSCRNLFRSIELSRWFSHLCNVATQRDCWNIQRVAERTRCTWTSAVV